MKARTQTITFSFVIIFCFLTYLSCNNNKDDQGKETPKEKVNGDFEMNPPIALSTEIRQLENPVNDKNFLLTANLRRAS